MYNGMYKSYLLVGVRQNTHCSTETNPFYSFFSHVYKIISPISAMRQDGFTFFRCLFVPRSGSPSLNSRNDDDQQHYQQNAKGATSPNGFALSLALTHCETLCVCESKTHRPHLCVCVYLSIFHSPSSFPFVLAIPASSSSFRGLTSTHHSADNTDRRKQGETTTERNSNVA